MDEAKQTPKVVFEGISETEQKTLKFQSAYQDMLSQLTAPGFIPVLCAHEAAHMIYFTAAGAREFDPIPATIKFNSQTNDYEGHLAAVKVQDLPDWTASKFNDWFSKVAYAHVAGGVVARKLMPSSDGGDQNDKARFLSLCETLNKDPNLNLDGEKLWAEAQTVVAEQIDNPELLRVIVQEAEQLRIAFGL